MQEHSHPKANERTQREKSINQSNPSTNESTNRWPSSRQIMQCESENLTHNEQAIAELLQNKHFSESVNGIVVRLQKKRKIYRFATPPQNSFSTFNWPMTLTSNDCGSSCKQSLVVTAC